MDTMHFWKHFFWVQCLKPNLHLPTEHIFLGNLNKTDTENHMGSCVNLFLVWNFPLLVRTNIQGQHFYIQGCSRPTTFFNSYIKYNKTMLYAHSHIQQEIMMIADILNADFKTLSLTQFIAKFNLEWHENTYDKLTSAIWIEWRTLSPSNTSTTVKKCQSLLYTAKSI